MKKVVIAWILTFALVFSIVGVAGAITDGVDDGDGHPFVGMYYFSDPDGNWRCSGTLLSPTVFLTAGHCTYQAFNARVSFDPEITDDSIWYTGTAYALPTYTEDTWYMNDVGVVILDEPVEGITTFGTLPEIGAFDDFMPSRGKETYFAAVGYGLQASFPDGASWKTEAAKTRMVAYPYLLQLNAPGMTGDFSMLLSNNHASGGTCFGDSGGPNFLMLDKKTETNIVAGVTSYGMNVSCAGTGGVFRMDRQNVQDFVCDYLDCEP